ncbi:hypothetical protein STENM36S_01156 [Streptomyces tendae]
MSHALAERHSGFSRTGLERVHDVLARHVDFRKMSGIVALVSIGLLLTHVGASVPPVQLMHDFWTTLCQALDF